MKDIAAGVAICGITGRNGTGKTLLGAGIVIERMKTGRRVLSTVPVTYQGEAKKGARPDILSTEPILSLRQLLEERDCMFFLDDVSVIFSSRSTNSLPHEMVSFLQTVRHHKIDILWTAPAWMRCDNLLRSVTQGCIGVIPMFNRRVGDSPWPIPRVVMAGLMDTSVGKADDTPTKVLRRAFYVPTHLPSWGAYDTHADTPMLGGHVQGGVCADCGGSIKRQAHSKELHEALGIPWYDDAVDEVAPAGVHFEDAA